MGWGVWRLFFNTDEPIRWEEGAKTNVMKNSCNATCDKGYASKWSKEITGRIACV